MSRGDAVQTLLEAGFMTDVAEVPGNEPADTVTAQTPQEGQPLTEGATVQVSVSDGLGLSKPDQPQPQPPEPDDAGRPIIPLPDDNGRGRPDWPFPFDPPGRDGRRNGTPIEQPQN
jgi:beta-lactam-binding protein with PASTA domain